jgi:uncharacterized protein YecE (DUF72 family)
VATVRVGIGGWVFPEWRGEFYPKGLPQSQELNYAGRHLTSIEINGTFYGTQKADSFRRWYSETPDGFIFSVKGPRYATHRREFADVGSTMDRFFNSGVLELREKLGPILWQFPATSRFDEAAFELFLKALPSNIDGRRIRHVVEVRHRSFGTDLFSKLLARYAVVPTLVDGDGYLKFRAIEGGLIYARLRRCELTHLTGYSSADLDRWAQRFRGWADGLSSTADDADDFDHWPRPGHPSDCFVYFINGAKVRAPRAAAALIERLNQTVV